MRKTPPFITPFAILSIIILLGASNVFENKVTHTHEGAPVQPARVVNNGQTRNNVGNGQKAPAPSGSKNDQKPGDNGSDRSTTDKSSSDSGQNSSDKSQPAKQTPQKSNSQAKPSNSGQSAGSGKSNQ